MPVTRPAIRPHLSAIDIEASASSESSTSTTKHLGDRQKLASPTSRDIKPAPPISRKYEIQQKYRQLSTIGFTSLVMGSWELLLTTNSLSLHNGGLAGLFWASIWAHIGQFFIVLSLAEMSSMVPVSGGQYRFVTAFAPAKSERFLSYCSGWICSIGWQARFTLHCYVITNLIQSLIQPEMAATRWQTHLLMILIALVMSAFNAFAAGHLSVAEGISAICHVFVLVPILVSLWVLASPKESAANVFSSFTDNGGKHKWPSTALSVCVGQLSSIFVVLGSDAMAYIAEEVEDAEIIVPRCMVWSFLFNAPITLGLIVTFLFNLGSVTDALSDEHALTSIFDRMLDGNRGATIGFTSIILVMLVMIAVSTMVATSRHLYAFGRDRALFYSASIGKVHQKLKVPLNSIVMTVMITSFIALVTIPTGSSLHTIIGLSTACFMATYMVSLSCLIRKRLLQEELPYARWSLGRAGLGINCIALFYSVWAFWWSFWPTQYVVHPKNFNYAAPLFLMVLCCASAFFAACLYKESRYSRAL